MKQFLTEATKVKWVKISRILFEEVNNATHLGEVVLSDEKDLKTGGMINLIISKTSKDIAKSLNSESTSENFECDVLGSRREPGRAL